MKSKMLIGIMLVGVMLMLSACATHIESRCIDAGLSISSLKIEDTGVFTSHAVVECKK